MFANYMCPPCTVAIDEKLNSGLFICLGNPRSVACNCLLSHCHIK